MALKLIQPNWLAPTKVKAFCTTRKNGHSERPWSGLNLALHVGDKEQTVQQNRELLAQETQLPSPHWLQQTHSTRVIRHSNNTNDADACFTTGSDKSCVVMSADCLPILLCDEEGSWVAAVHAGWRGLASGIIYECVKQYQASSPLMAWIGPAISQEFFEVGSEVRDIFINQNKALDKYFEATSNFKWQCNLAAIAQHQLEQLQPSGQPIQVFQSGLCSYRDSDDFYSHRRATHELNAQSSQSSLATTGRMASVIWLEH